MYVGGKRQIKSCQITGQSDESDDDETYIIIPFDMHPPIREYAADYYTDNSKPRQLPAYQLLILHHFLIKNFFQYMLGCQKCFH